MGDREDGYGREAKQSKQIAELRRENKMLRRMVNNLQKRLNRANGSLYAEEQSPEEESPEASPEPVAQKKCPDCGSQNLADLDTPTKKLVICKDCKNRM